MLCRHTDTGNTRMSVAVPLKQCNENTQNKLIFYAFNAFKPFQKLIK